MNLWLRTLIRVSVAGAIFAWFGYQTLKLPGTPQSKALQFGALLVVLGVVAIVLGRVFDRGAPTLHEDLTRTWGYGLPKSTRPYQFAALILIGLGLMAWGYFGTPH